MLNIRLNILIILFFIISCSNNKNLIVGDWSLSEDFISKNISFPKNLDQNHESELNEKFSKMLQSDIIYSFKDDMSFKLIHFQNNDLATMNGVWSIEDNQIRIDIDENNTKTYTVQVDASKLILEDVDKEKIIFYRK